MDVIVDSLNVSFIDEDLFVGELTFIERNRAENYAYQSGKDLDLEAEESRLVIVVQVYHAQKGI